MGQSFSTNLIYRACTGAILVGVLLGGLFLGGPWWQLLCMLIALASLWEFYSLMRNQHTFPVIVGIAAACYILLTAYRPNWGMVVFALVLSVFVTFLIELIKREFTGESSGADSCGVILMGLVYVVIPWSLMIGLRATPYGHIATLTLFLCTWSCDVFAYLIGSRWGAHHPVCSVSPHKSTEGFIGGALASVLCSALCAFFLKVQPLPFVIIGVVCGTLGQFGDLVESLIKREMGVKDSGDLLPGHGGFLDRFDSILLSGAVTTLIWGYLL
ncbi:MULTISPECIES: phosphatidate cytidylyltransferase [Jonquetella]|uniref:phosphatidate cytidylyltransferase n=1 Tax=Jonquetella TaxID=428711 RepID=UPI0005879CBD|nr:MULTISPECIES: phosphatidate cytidylyltransferase [Jonquetella]